MATLFRKRRYGHWHINYRFKSRQFRVSTGTTIKKLAIEKLKKLLEKELGIKKRGELKIEIKEVKNTWVSASLVSQWIASRLEKRIHFRRVLKRALSQIISNREVKGARVQVSGRLNGIEIARTEWLREGQLPRHTIRADIDYAQTEAICTYGKIGVKIWIYKGEK